MSETKRLEPLDGPHYPERRDHEWGAFPQLAIEAGGYGDVTVINPWNGAQLWISDVFDEDTPLPVLLRRIADAVEASGWDGES